MAFDKNNLSLDDLKKDAKARIASLRDDGGVGRGTALFWAAKDLICLTQSDRELKNVQASITALDKSARPTETDWSFDKQAGGFVLKQGIGALAQNLAKAARTEVWVGKAPRPEQPEGTEDEEVAKKGTADVFLLKLRDPERLRKQLKKLVAYTRKNPDGEMFMWGLESAKDGRPLFLIGPKPKVDKDGLKLLRGSDNQSHIRARVRYQDGELVTNPIRGTWKKFALELRKSLQGKLKAVRIDPKAFKELSEEQLDALQAGIEEISEQELLAIADEPFAEMELENKADTEEVANATLRAAESAEEKAEKVRQKALETASAAQAALLAEYRLLVLARLGPGDSEKVLRAALAQVAKRDPLIYETLALLREKMTTIDRALADAGMGKKERLASWAEIPAPLRTGKLNPRRSEFYKVANVRAELLANTASGEDDWKTLAGDLAGSLGTVVGDVGSLVGLASGGLGLAGELGANVEKISDAVGSVGDKVGLAGAGLGVPGTLSDIGDLRAGSEEENPLKKRVAEQRRKKKMADLGLDTLGTGLGVASTFTEGAIANIPVLGIASGLTSAAQSGLALREANQLRQANNRAAAMHKARNNPNQALLQSLGQDQGVQKTRMAQAGVDLTLTLISTGAGLAPGVGSIVSAAASLAQTGASIAFRVASTKAALDARSAEAQARGTDAGEAEELAAFRDHPHYAKIELALSAKRGDPEAVAWFQARGVLPSLLLRDDTNLGDLVDVALSSADESADPTTMLDDVRDVGAKLGKVLSRLQSEETRLKKLVANDPTAQGPLFNTQLQVALTETSQAAAGLRQATSTLLEKKELGTLTPAGKEAEALKKELDAGKAALAELCTAANKLCADKKLEARWKAQLDDLAAMIAEEYGTAQPGESAEMDKVRKFGASFPDEVKAGLALLDAARAQLKKLADEAGKVDSLVLPEPQRDLVRINAGWQLGAATEGALATALSADAAGKSGKASGKDEAAAALKSVTEALGQLRILVGANPSALPAATDRVLKQAGAHLGNLEAEIEQAEALISGGHMSETEQQRSRIQAVVDFTASIKNSAPADRDAYANGLATATGLVETLQALADPEKQKENPDKAALEKQKDALDAALKLLRVQRAVLEQALEAATGLVALVPLLEDRAKYALEITGGQKQRPASYKVWKEVMTLLGEGRAQIQEASTRVAEAQEILTLLHRAAEAGADAAERKELLVELRGKRDAVQKLCKALSASPDRFKKYQIGVPKDDYETWTQEAMAAIPALVLPRENQQLVAELCQVAALYKIAKRDEPEPEPGRPPVLFAQDRQLLAFYNSIEALPSVSSQLDELNRLEDAGAPGGGKRRRQAALLGKFYQKRLAELQERKKLLAAVKPAEWKGSYKGALASMEYNLEDGFAALKDIYGRLDAYYKHPATEPTPTVDVPSIRHLVAKDDTKTQAKLTELANRRAALQAPMDTKLAGDLRRELLTHNRMANGWLRQISADQAVLDKRKATLKGERHQVDLDDCTWALGQLKPLYSAYAEQARRSKQLAEGLPR